MHPEDGLHQAYHPVRADVVRRAADENQLYVETMFNLGKNVGALAAQIHSGGRFPIGSGVVVVERADALGAGGRRADKLCIRRHARSKVTDESSRMHGHVR